MKHRFTDFIQAREAMRLHKVHRVGTGFKTCGVGANRHSNDPILAEFSFCNINREHDYVTRWIDEHVRKPLGNAGINVMVQNLTVARIFNHPPCLEEILPYESGSELLIRLKGRKLAKQKIFRKAYMMPSHIPTGTRMDASTYWATKVIPKVAKLDFTMETALGAIAAKLMTVNGIGSFLANQIVTDLRYIPDGYNWTDWGTFVLAGPGTRRGLNRYYGRDLKCSSADFELELAMIREEISPVLPQAIAGYLKDPNNLANCFCEFDKYCRAQEFAALGERINLRKYHGNPNP